MNEVNRQSVSDAGLDPAIAAVFERWRDRMAWFNVRAAIVISLSISVALLPFALPVADDFCRAALDRNWLDFVGEMYRTWTGRWAAMSFYVTVLSRVDVTSAFYPATLTLIYLVCALAWYGVARMLLEKRLGRWGCALAGAALVALYWTGMPEPGETIYWLSGSFEYTLPFAVCVFTMWLMIVTPTWLGTVVAAALALLVGGLQEIAAVPLVFVLGFATASALWFRSRTAPQWIAVSLVGAVGLAINAVAPGNAVRLEEDFGAGNAHDFVATLMVTAEQIREYLIPWLLDPKLLAASTLLVLTPWFRSAPPRWFAASPIYWRAAVPLVWLLAVTGVFLALGWAVGRVGPARLYNFTYGVFLLGWFATLFVWSSGLESAAGATAANVRFVASCVLLLGTVTSINAARGLGDFIGDQNVMRFKHEMRQRFDAVAGAKKRGEREVVLDLQPRIAESFFQRDIGPDPAQWRNVCVASYFGIDKIRVAAPPQ